MAPTVTKSLLVAGAPDDIYTVWSNFEHFPNFMQNIESITRIDEKTSHWVMSGPMGVRLDWRAETTRNEPGQRIAWRSTDESRMKTSGQVTFAKMPHNSTEITVTLHYEPPAGVIGEAAASLFADPEETLIQDLRNFKMYYEKIRQPASG